DRQLPPDRGPRMNEQIRISPIRLIGAAGEQLGLVPTAQALEKAREAGLDLVEVAADERPPGCKILDYGTLRLENSQHGNPSRRRHRRRNRNRRHRNRRPDGGAPAATACCARRAACCRGPLAGFLGIVSLGRFLECGGLTPLWMVLSEVKYPKRVQENPSK